MAALMHQFVSESAGIKVLIFVTFAGVKVSAIKSAAAAVLPKHYSDDLHPETWRVFSSCGRRCVVTANPRIMVEPFLKNYLGVDLVIGTEIASFKGFATGLVAAGDTDDKVAALRKALHNDETLNVGIGDRTDLPFMRLCKERYVVRRKPGIRPVRAETLAKPVIFHDGRLVQKPTPLVALLIILWFPIGIILSILRIFIGSMLPISTTRYVLYLLGFQIIPKGTPPHAAAAHSSAGKGVVFVCSHRNVLDAVIVSTCLGRMTTTISYSVAGFTEFLSPIKTSRLTRDRATDARLIEQILNEGKSLVMCPEGTTCREPYLLRFSSLFAELADRIVPVAVVVKTSLFHGTTARGHKWLDPFFFCMNPFPVYEITFLNKLSDDQTCGAGGKSSYEVANNVQKMIAETLGYKCTDLTRKDKYRALAGTDGLVDSTTNLP
ncbi:glycerol-3-phosphate acyltransferase 5 [Perilla frutescens var. hirtella]|uniref:Glycerol-3-phosphate acyltransferase 5 n=1 Tax=Perilla frutescens var. hirtella TaxID=608512 RepID=A0AAD4JIS8_PERFH|nr:glycerol-3-phosphate acyltransferase 5 [Perilla frutescens var. frutescens]KAH6786910.1 glycerol-3-phosphate acyltransferase 5 [Perilla frutescens var. hirtella]KAH6834556.1 glycerol-3-phosphate acyltransferase 5 [Perilla frutescens var. hirtella]